MAADGQLARPMSRGKLLLATGGALIAGVLIVIGAIMPAEFNRDPLGLGKLSGIKRLWAPPERAIDPNAGAVQRAHDYGAAFRTDVIEIPLSDFLGGVFGSELEYKVAMKEDATLIYHWEVIGAARPDEFHYDFHGHTIPKTETEEMTVATYKQGYGLSGDGALTAPFDGIQGWQFSNTGEKSVVVRVRLAGFYDLVPSYEPGNESGIIANLPAPKSRPDMPPRLPDSSRPRIPPKVSAG